MKVVYDNIIFSLQKAGGISMYWSELIKRAGSTVTYYGSDNENIFFKDLDIDQQKESDLPISILRAIPFTKKLPEGSIFHSSYYRISSQKGVKNITTVHDFTHEKYGTGFRNLALKIMKQYAVKKSDGVICVSENTKKDLLKFYPDVDVSKVTVIHEAATDDFKQIDSEKVDVPESCSDVRNDFVLYVGSRASYKNFDVTVDAVAKDDSLHLVIVGGGTATPKEEDMLHEKLPGRHICLGSISSEDLNWLYNKAHCLCYPSQYEGFGIPLVEAMKAGCPVVSTNISSIPEVAGDAALLVDHVNEETLYTQISKLKDIEVRNSYITKGLQQATKFSWDMCFEKTKSFYRTIALK